MLTVPLTAGRLVGMEFAHSTGISPEATMPRPTPCGFVVVVGVGSSGDVIAVMIKLIVGVIAAFDTSDVLCFDDNSDNNVALVMVRVGCFRCCVAIFVVVGGGGVYVCVCLYLYNCT